MRNTASLIRIRDEVDIPVTQLTVALDINSWCWTLRARLPLSSIAGVPTYPGTVRATINGFAWDFIVDVLTETQQPTGNTAFERILISGGKEGGVVLATRAGTGGATTAPAVVDWLITDVPAAAGRPLFVHRAVRGLRSELNPHPL